MNGPAWSRDDPTPLVERIDRPDDWAAAELEYRNVLAALVNQCRIHPAVASVMAHDEVIARRAQRRRRTTLRVVQ